MVARLVAESKRARSSRSNSAAVRTRMPGCVEAARAPHRGRTGPAAWNCGNCFSTMPQTKTTGSTHCRASCALSTWTTLRRSSSRRRGLRRSTACHGAPEFREGDMARGRRARRRLRPAPRRTGRARRPGCATAGPFRGRRPRRAARGGRGCAECESAPPSPADRARSAPLFQLGELIDEANRAASAAGDGSPPSAGRSSARSG